MRLCLRHQAARAGLGVVTIIMNFIIITEVQFSNIQETLEWVAGWLGEEHLLNIGDVMLGTARAYNVANRCKGGQFNWKYKHITIKPKMCEFRHRANLFCE